VWAKIFQSRHSVFRASEKNHGLIANFSAQRFVSDFVGPTGHVPFIFEKHLISLEAASPEIKPFIEKAAVSQKSCGRADVNHLRL
jgi:hypothetical protein